MKLSTPAVDEATLAALARHASADTRSVLRRLAGLPVRGLAGQRVDAALAEWRRGELRLEDGKPLRGQP